MPLYQWNESYSVGIDEMDREHQKLFSLINDLYDALKIGGSKTIMEKVFDDLFQYARVHFSDEEELMKKYDYPALAEQQTQHGSFVKKINNELIRFKNGSLLVGVEMMNFLNDWLVNHIQLFDKKYGLYINDKEKI